MSNVIKGQILRQDLDLYDGINKEGSRQDQTRGVITGLRIGDEVDVLSVYGFGVNRTSLAIQDALNAVGTNSVTFLLSVGTWSIDDDLTIPSTINCHIPSGCILQVASGKTLTFNGPIQRESETWTSGSGTVTTTASNNVLVHSSDLAASGGSALIGHLPAGTGAVARTQKSKNDETTDSTDFLAVGDDTADDTAELQAMLDAGFSKVKLSKDKTFKVSSAGSKTINGTAQFYCLTIPSDTSLDLNGSTIKAADASNASLIMNSTAGTTQNTDIEIFGGWLDGNQSNQTSPATGETGCLYLHDVDRPKIYNINVKNARIYAGRFLKCVNGYFDNLRLESSYGDGWSFGIDANSNQSQECHIDNIYADDCKGTYAGLQGNGFIGVFQQCQVGKVYTKNKVVQMIQQTLALKFKVMEQGCPLLTLLSTVLSR